MKRVIIGALCAVCFCSPARTETKPDFTTAYVLATASYCAYAATNLESATDRQERAWRCLKAAAALDPERLDALDVPQTAVDAYVDFGSPENAYVLTQAKNGVILAFRGTIVPPIDPKDNFFHTTADALAKSNEGAIKGFKTFAADWLNNFQAKGDAEGRHHGFNESWRQLQEALKCKRPGQINCHPLSDRLASLNSAKGEKLFITGHSKGGALATLAAIDLPEAFPGVSVVTYTFAAAKALTAKAAEHLPPPSDFWRFERADDLVPAIAPDSTSWLAWALGLPAYAHIGRLALFEGSATAPTFPQPSGGVYPPGDNRRLSRFGGGVATTVFGSLVKFDLGRFISAALNGGATACGPFVLNHFAVFADVRSLARTGDANGVFFRRRLKGDDGRDILWGYEEWCRMFQMVSQ